MSVQFSLLIPKMLTFTLAISCLTTSNLPWFMDLTFQVPMQYCCLQHQTLLPSPVTSTTGWFLLWLRLFILSGVISPLISNSILGIYWSREFIFQCPIFLPFHTVHGVLKARIPNILNFFKKYSKNKHYSLIDANYKKKIVTSEETLISIYNKNFLQIRNKTKFKDLNWKMVEVY